MIDGFRCNREFSESLTGYLQPPKRVLVMPDSQRQLMKTLIVLLIAGPFCQNSPIATNIPSLLFNIWQLFHDHGVRHCVSWNSSPHVSSWWWSQWHPVSVKWNGYMSTNTSTIYNSDELMKIEQIAACTGWTNSLVELNKFHLKRLIRKHTRNEP